MRIVSVALLAPALLSPVLAHAQSAYIAPDGKNRYPGVTIFCPNGTGVAPCSFGGGGSGGAVTINLGGSAVGTANPFPVKDSLLEGLISGGALKVGGSVAISGTPSVALAGAPSVGIAGALPAGSNVLGSVNLAPGSVGSVTLGGTGGTVAQAVQGIGGGVPLSVTGSVAQTGTWNVGVSSLPALAAGSNAIGSVSVSNFPSSQPVSGAVSVSALPALPAGANAIGSVSVSNFPAMQPVSGSVAVSGLPALPAGSNAIGSVSVSNFPATQPVSGSVAVSGLPALPTGSNAIGSVSVSNFPATQPVSVASLPLPSGASSSSVNQPAYLVAVTSSSAFYYTNIYTSAGTIAQAVKTTGAGQVYSYRVSNGNASQGIWFRLFAATSATAGSGAPAERVFIPANQTLVFSTDMGEPFSNGISYTVTGGASDTDTTSVTGPVAVNVTYR
jgi:hypothetical protein